MSKGTQIKVYGKTYQIKAGTSAVDAEALAELVDSKMQELATGAAKASTLDLAVLTALNIAQELFETQQALADERQQNTRRQEDTDRRLNSLEKQVESALT